MAIESRKFKEFDYFEDSTVKKYSLLPFNFRRVNDSEILSNAVGESLLVPLGTTQKIVDRKINSKEKIFEDLVAKSFISLHNIPPQIDLLATRYRTKKSFLDSFTGLFIFVISLRCEHTCHYCQVSRVTQNKDKFDMSFNHIDKGIQMMLAGPNPSVTMEFQGGEALLAFDKIQYGVKKAIELNEDIGKDLRFVICTNLALIDDEILDFCEEYDILISTSLDGPKFIHDSNRNKPNASSYDYTKKGIEHVRRRLGTDKVSALMTTSNLSLEHPEEIVDEYVNSGFRGIFLRNISPYGFATRGTKNTYDTSKFVEFYKKALERIFWYNINGTDFREEFSSILLSKIYKPFSNGFVDLLSPSGIVNSAIVFNYNGEIYASDEGRMLAEMRDKRFCFGHLDSDKLEDVVKSEQYESLKDSLCNESMAGCSSCAYQHYCGADPVYHYAVQGDSYGHRSFSGYCEKNMSVLDHIFSIVKNDSVEAEILKSWIR